MLLAIDIGNTNIEAGVLSFKAGEIKILKEVRFYTRQNITSDELGIFLLNFLSINQIDRYKIKSLIYSSVVLPLNRIVEDMFSTFFNENILKVSTSNNLKMGITNSYKNPREVGADRLVNASAVYNIYKKDAIVVDMGTATTIDVVSKDGRYLGGTIFPGIATATQALKEKTSRLPSIDICYCDRLLTDDTLSAIESGVYFSNYYALKGMIERIAEEAQFSDYIKIATGGISKIFLKSGLFDFIDDVLPLKGLKIIFDLNNVQ
ncbi:MAG TPA: type III pantothenate kinase [Spirochaetota bacterium]|jgi:type III pantothenate kinase|nr:MAG: Type III pantothenate kinase [Spirochaetes bacterium ADurb.Bin133]HNZ27081.1 type III pantothenate kinase [Spirochaetota bacterium]HPY87829.1 type III pantothenate kinase [Spirochaetota bacterium]